MKTDAPAVIRPHPLTVRRYLTKYSTLFLLPAVQGLAGLYSARSLSRTVTTALLVSALWVTLALLRYRRFRFCLYERYAEITQGLLLRRESRVEYGRVSCILIKRTLVSVLFGGAEVRFETEAGSRRQSDFQCFLRERDVPRLIEFVYGSEPASCTVRFPLRGIIILCAMTSSAATGLLTAAPLADQAGKFLGEGISRQLYGTIDQAAIFLGRLLPDVGGYLAAAFLIGYLAAFLFMFSRYAGFRLRLSDGTLRASGGLASGFTAVFRKSAIGAVAAEQGSLLRLTGMSSVRVCIAGYGKNRGESALLIPCVKNRRLSLSVRALTPGFSLPEPELRSRRDAWKRFLLLPALLTAGALAGTVFLALRTDYYARLYALAGASAVVFFTFWFSAQWICLKKGGLRLRGSCSAVFRRGLKILRIEIAPGRAGFLRVREGPADRRNGTCSVHTAVRSERAAGIFVPCLEKDEVRRAILREYGEDIFAGEAPDGRQESSGGEG